MALAAEYLLICLKNGAIGKQYAFPPSYFILGKLEKHQCFIERIFLSMLQKLYMIFLVEYRLSFQRGDKMSYKDQLDPHSELFHHNWTRPKRSKSQVNGHTEMSKTNFILRRNAKAHRW